MLAAMGLLAVMTILAAVGLTAMRSAASTVPPPDDVHWLQLADCESGGRAHLATGNGFYGALQWLPSTWAAARGPDDPLRAVDADLATEIAVAYDWAHRADPFGQWPACWPAALARPNSDVPAWATVSPGDGDPAPPATPTQQPVLLTG